MEPNILQRSEHPVSRKHISPEALKVLYRLNDKGYKAYLAGGCVRDLLLGRTPKDFDVVTDATPQEVRRCFNHCRLIGRRFRLAHVIFGQEVIEVATFRASGAADDQVDSLPSEELENGESADDADEREDDVADEEEFLEPEPAAVNPDLMVHGETGMVLRDNVFGSPEEDAFRRDFTINGMFYNIHDFSIIDYVGGLADIERRVVHCIGDPDLRYQEDPVRMIRALRFAASLDLTIEDNTFQAILRQREHLAHASNARMFEEILKFFHSGAMSKAFGLWKDTGLLEVMFPGFAEWFLHQATPAETEWIQQAFRQMDKWKLNQVRASPELLYAMLLGPYIRSRAAAAMDGEKSVYEALRDAVMDVQRELSVRVLIPKRVAFLVFDLLGNQDRFQDRSHPARVERFVRRPFFRDALVLYKFDCLARGEAQPELLMAWSRDLQNAPAQGPRESRPRRPRRRRQRRN
jgi:poly(A) polymerase